MEIKPVCLLPSHGSVYITGCRQMMVVYPGPEECPTGITTIAFGLCFSYKHHGDMNMLGKVYLFRSMHKLTENELYRLKQNNTMTSFSI